MEKVRQGEGGFTLLEVLIVILILAVLAAMVVFNVGGFIGQGTEQIAKMQGNLVQTAITAAMALESTANVVEGNIGDVGDGTSITKPADWTLTVGNKTVNKTVNMSKYVTSDIQGYWEWDGSGIIINGTYTGGGKTCTYDNGNWTC